MEHGDQVEELTLEPAGAGRPTRRRALWGVLAAVGVAAGALVVTSTGEDGTPRPGLPVALGSAVAAREASGAADSMMPAWITYVAGDDLPPLGGEAPAYQLTSTVTEDQVRALADALDIDGDVVRDESGWSVYGDVDSVHVTEGGGGQWWFSPSTVASPGGTGSSGAAAGCEDATDCTTTTSIDCGASDGPAECITSECPDGASCAVLHEGTATPCGDGGACTEAAPTTTIACDGPTDDCIEPVPPGDGDCAVHADGFDPCAVDPPVPPADLPSEEEARAIALDLLAATGVDVDDAVVTVDGPYDAWYVSVEPRLGGVPSGLVASVSVGSDGVITSASGYLAVPERLGVYPVLGTRATIDRANAQSGVGGEPVTTVPGDVGEQTFDSTGTAIGGVDDIDATTIPPCKVQADGSEICETTTVEDPGCVNAAEDEAMDRDLICELPTCPQVVSPADEPLQAPETIDCVPPVPDPGLEGGPIEVVLVDAERALVMLGAVDGTADLYLVPAYRFTDADGGRVDLAAVADSELTTPPTTGTSAPDPVDPPVTPTVPPRSCEPLVEEDASGSTHTVQPNPDCVVPEPQVLGEGQEPEIGVGYYVDVDTECGSGSFELGGRVWTTDTDTGAWTEDRHEGGTFTLDAPDHGTFVGDSAATKVAEFRTLGPAEDLFCMPQPRP